MNNPPDVSQDSKEYEEYAHNVQKHVRGYLMVGATLIVFTAVTVALSYVDFGAPKANIAVAMLVATLSHPHFHRLFCPRTFLAYIPGVVRLPGCSLDVA